MRKNGDMWCSHATLLQCLFPPWFQYMRDLYPGLMHGNNLNVFQLQFLLTFSTKPFTSKIFKRCHWILYYRQEFQQRSGSVRVLGKKRVTWNSYKNEWSKIFFLSWVTIHMWHFSKPSSIFFSDCISTKEERELWTCLFVPQNIQWFNISDLPSHKKDTVSRENLGLNPNAFFMVMPFVK